MGSDLTLITLGLLYAGLPEDVLTIAAIRKNRVTTESRRRVRILLT